MQLQGWRYESEKDFEKVFSESMKLLREYEKTLLLKTDVEYAENVQDVKQCVLKVVSEIEEKRHDD